MHKPGWLHFENRALDVRGNNISVAKANGLRARVMALVGKDYHVQLLVGGGELT